MPVSPPQLPPANATVLLVLLPLMAAGVARQVRASTRPMLEALQHRLGSRIQVLVVEEESDPDVVHSFRAAPLPAFLLVRQGIELWRQPGLPEGEQMAEQLLHRLRLADGLPPPGTR